MNRVFTFLLIFTFLASCASVQTTQTPPTFIPTLFVFEPTFTFVPPSAMVTPVVLTSTATPEVCDPFAVDYCISEGRFIFQRPIKLPANASIDRTYTYASTANGRREPHHGVEFLNKFGTPVYAAGDGVVVFAGLDSNAVYSPWPNFYGNVIVIGHADDLYTLYAHLSKINVEVNQKVFAGVPIGEVGQSGAAIGPHLHFEVRHGNVENYFSTMNPQLWLIPNNGSNGRLGVLQISILDQKHHLIRHAEFTATYSADKIQSTNTTFFGATYSADMLSGDENAVLGDLVPGYYRIAFKYNGQLYERWVEVESGKLTQVVFVVK